MTWTWIASLQMLALLLLVGEVFLPTFGILTLATLAAIGGSLWLARDLGTVPWILAGADLLFFPALAWYLLARIGPGPLGLSAALEPGKTTAEVAPGLKGCTLTDLRPVGKGRLGAQTYDIVSGAGFLPAGQEIIVVETGNNRIVVRAATGPGTPNGA